VAAIGTELLQPFRELHAPNVRSPRRGRKHAPIVSTSSLQPQLRSLEAKIGSTSTNRARKEQAEGSVAKQKSRSCAFPAHLFEVMRGAQDWATVGVATVVRRSNGTIDHAAIALTNMGARHPCGRVPRKGARHARRLGPASQVVAKKSDQPSDASGSAEYRRHLATVLTRPALEEAGRTGTRQPQPGRGAGPHSSDARASEKPLRTRGTSLARAIHSAAAANAHRVPDAADHERGLLDAYDAREKAVMPASR
jgi:CO dehydrogenase flavoprotein C-terminal domain